MPNPLPTPSISLPNVVLGRGEPRLFTPPLRDLTNPDASWGHDFIDFCELIGHPLDLWQQWLALHLGELYEDGSPRFTKALILVARQNGKSMFAVLLTLYWMFVERVPLIFGTHKDRPEAKKAWRESVELAESTDLLAAQLPDVHIVKQISEEDFFNIHGSHNLFGAPNRRAARGKTVHRVLVDELREHRDRECWNALVPATNAVGNPLIVLLSNEGDVESVVLHEEHDAALSVIETGEGDPRVFLASWSCPTGSDPLDVAALAYANPSLNRIRPNGTGLRESSLLSQAMTAVKAGGDTLNSLRSEMMGERVGLLDAAIRAEDWSASGRPVEQAINLAEHRRQVVLCFDVASDSSHATLAAAATIDGITHVEIIAAWSGYESRKELRRDLPGIVAKVRPRKVVWFPGGPAAAVADQWGKRIGGVLLDAIRAEDRVRACMGMEEQAAADHLRHYHDPLLDKQVPQTQRLPQGDGWVFERRGQAPIDATYAVAGAIHAARRIPKLGPVA